MLKHTKTKRIKHSNVPVQVAITKCYSSLGGNIKQAPDYSFCDFTCTMDEFFFLDNCYRILAKHYQTLRNKYDHTNEYLPTTFKEWFANGFNGTKEPTSKGPSYSCYKLGKAYRRSCELFLQGK